LACAISTRPRKLPNFGFKARDSACDAAPKHLRNPHDHGEMTLVTQDPSMIEKLRRHAEHLLSIVHVHLTSSFGGEGRHLRID